MKILFVCQANVCRSVLAQELLKKYAPCVYVWSRGLYVTGPTAMPLAVRKYLISQGLQQAEHTPTQLAPQDMQAADWVFCMEPQQLEQLTDMYAQYTDKIWLLNEFVYGKETPVLDPLQFAEKECTKQMDILQHTLEQCARKLTSASALLPEK